jgi:hypothetical protein
MDKSVQLSAEQIIICEPDFSSKWEPTRNYRLHIKGITIFRGLEANCQWMKEQIETAFAEAYARAAAPRDTEQREIVTPANPHDCRCGERGADGTGEHYQIVANVETRRGTRVPVCVNHIGNYAAYPDNYRIFLTASAVGKTTTPQATCPECAAKSQLTLTATGPWIYVTCGACRQWWSIGEIEHTPYFFGGEPASNGPRKVMTCSVEGCTNPSRWQSRCEFHLNEANSATKPESTVAAPQNSERPWIKCSKWLPANNEVVETKIDEGAGVHNEQTLKRRDNLWFLPDGSMRVYYCPTHWRSVNEPRAKV